MIAFRNHLKAARQQVIDYNSNVEINNSVELMQYLNIIVTMLDHMLADNHWVYLIKMEHEQSTLPLWKTLDIALMEYIDLSMVLAETDFEYEYEQSCIAELTDNIPF